jgi:hypothetical protein
MADKSKMEWTRDPGRKETRNERRAAMRKMYGKAMSVAIWVVGLLVVGRSMAGSLDPTNAPGPTMHTLEEIYQTGEENRQKLELLVAPRTLSATTTVVAAGYYAATNLTQVDTDLAAVNIAMNVTLFGNRDTENECLSYCDAEDGTDELIWDGG